MSQATVTTNHDDIRRWADERGGRPAIVRTGQGPGGILRFDFGGDDERLENISWDEFFRVFEDNQLALLRQEETAAGQQSRFFQFVDRNTSSGVSHETEIGNEADMGGQMREDRQEHVSAQTGRDQDQPREASEPRRPAARRPAAKRSSAKQTSTRSATSRSSGRSAKRGAAARKTTGRKTSSRSAGSTRSGARKATSRSASAKKPATKRAGSSSKRGSTSSSRSRPAKRTARKSR